MCSLIDEQKLMKLRLHPMKVGIKKKYELMILHLISHRTLKYIPNIVLSMEWTLSL